jgi:hypothetical protein
VQVKRELYPCVTVHNLSHAVAALAPGRAVTLLSGEGAASYAGCGWWRALVAAARARHPDTPARDILDCADAPGRAMEALRLGQPAVVLWRGSPAFAAVAAAAAEGGAELLGERPPSLDLAAADGARRLAAWLAGDTGTMR